MPQSIQSALSASEQEEWQKWLEDKVSTSLRDNTDPVDHADFMVEIDQLIIEAKAAVEKRED